jgi:hypothetical protein
MGVKQAMSFGWRTNAGADGFEQDHGRFTMEVFWNEVKRVWAWNVWAGVSRAGKRDQSIVANGTEFLLHDAKKAVLRVASGLERQALVEDQKFR